MKHFNWLLVAFATVCLTIIPLTGCVVSQSKFEALQADYTVVKNQLDAISKVYPPRDFNSYSELSEWVSKHIKPYSSTAEKWYASALKVQEEALNDGYIVSAVIEDATDYSGLTEQQILNFPYSEQIFIAYNTAIVGDTMWYWNPEDGELFAHPIAVY